jgi:hypothetical protein
MITFCHVHFQHFLRELFLKKIACSKVVLLLFKTRFKIVGVTKLKINFLQIRLELTRQRRCLKWQATPSPNREMVSLAVMKTDGLAIDHDTARLFIDNDHMVFRVTISVVSD